MRLQLANVINVFVTVDFLVNILVSYADNSQPTKLKYMHLILHQNNFTSEI
jgi:hypothetical protein